MSREAKVDNNAELRELIADCKPGMSLDDIAAEAGVSAEKLKHYLKSGRSKRMPLPEVLVWFTRVLQTAYIRVLRAFLIDYGYGGVEVTTLTESEREMISCYQQLDSREQRYALTMVRELLNQSEDHKSRSRRRKRTKTRAADGGAGGGSEP